MSSIEDREQIVKQMREVYSALLDYSRTDPEVAAFAGIAGALDSIHVAAKKTQRFLETFHQHQNKRFATDLPSYDDAKAEGSELKDAK